MESNLTRFSSDSPLLILTVVRTSGDALSIDVLSASVLETMGRTEWWISESQAVIDSAVNTSIDRLHNLG